MGVTKRNRSSPDEPEQSTGSAASTRRRSRRSRLLKVMAWALGILVLLAAGTTAYLYESLLGNITALPLPLSAHRAPPAKPDARGRTPLNLLLLGSQTRDGQQGVNLGNESKLGTNISDTAMLVHIDAQRRWAVVASIPRDLIVPRPQCQGRIDPHSTVPASNGAMFDEAMNLGGPACAVATVEQMTGIRVDHFVEITFNALQDLTTAVGGVTVCVPPPGINDPDYSGLVLGPGRHTVMGSQALEFVRDRHGIGTGTDLGRIRMQQVFVSSLFTKLAAGGTLSNPLTLYRITKAVTSNITVDTGLNSPNAMVSLAGSVQGLSSHHVQLVTAPYDFGPADAARLVPGPGFDQLWSKLREDQPLPGSPAAADFGTSATTPAPTPSAPLPTSSPSPTAPARPATDTPHTSTPSPSTSISAQTRTGDQDICSDLPTPVPYGGHP